MGVFGGVFGCIGDGGFTLVCISGCRGVVGFNVVTSQLPVREKVRPARSDRGCEREKFALRAKNGQKLAVYGVPGELFRGNAAGGAVLGEFFRDKTAGCGVLGEFFRG